MQGSVAREAGDGLEHRGAIHINDLVVRGERHRVRGDARDKHTHGPRRRVLRLEHDTHLGLVDAQALEPVGILGLKVPARVNDTVERRVERVQPGHEDVGAVRGRKLGAAERHLERVEHVAEHALRLRVQVHAEVAGRAAGADQCPHKEAHVRAVLEALCVVQVDGRRRHRERRDLKVRLDAVELQLVRQGRLDVADRPLLDPLAAIEAPVRHEARVRARLAQQQRDAPHAGGVERVALLGQEAVHHREHVGLHALDIVRDRNAQHIHRVVCRGAKVLERRCERRRQLRERRTRCERADPQLGPRPPVHVVGQVRRRRLPLLFLGAVRQHVGGHLEVPCNERTHLAPRVLLLGKVDRHNVVRAVHTHHVRHERRIRDRELLVPEERVQHVRHIVWQVAQLAQHTQRRRLHVRLGRTTVVGAVRGTCTGASPGTGVAAVVRHTPA